MFFYLYYLIILKFIFFVIFKELLDLITSFSE